MKSVIRLADCINESIRHDGCCDGALPGLKFSRVFWMDSQMLCRSANEQRVAKSTSSSSASYTTWRRFDCPCWVDGGALDSIKSVSIVSWTSRAANLFSRLTSFASGSVVGENSNPLQEEACLDFNMSRTPSRVLMK